MIAVNNCLLEVTVNSYCTYYANASSRERCGKEGVIAVWFGAACDFWSAEMCPLQRRRATGLDCLWILAKDSSRGIDSLQKPRTTPPLFAISNTEASSHSPGLSPAMPHTFLLTYFPAHLCWLSGRSMATLTQDSLLL